MISTNIDGTIPGSNTLVELLGLISNPEAYAKKLAELEKATSEYKAYVALMGPANEIEKLRAEAAIDRDNAKKEADATRATAKALFEAAKTEAADILVKAKAEAKALTDDAKATKAEVKRLRVSLDTAIDEAHAAMDKAVDKAAEADAKLAEIEAKAEELAKAQADLIAEKEAIAARHKQFIESL